MSVHAGHAEVLHHILRPWMCTSSVWRDASYTFVRDKRHNLAKFSHLKTNLQFISRARAPSKATEVFDDWTWEEEPEFGPAFAATLKMLDWSSLTDQVAKFSQTKLGQQACRELLPARDESACQALLWETGSVDALLTEYAADLDFGGIQTAEASQALNRASRGGLMGGSSLIAVASLLIGAAKLQRTIATAAREADRTGHTALQPLVSMFKGIASLPEVVRDIGSSLEEGGQVRESASEDLKRARGRLRTIEGRLRGVLKSLPGEVTEHGGRMCVAVPATSDTPPKGILLGTGPGASVWYVEPGAAVSLNNDLGAARGEAFAAEEAVLWRLTGLVVDAVEPIQRTLNKVVWLDSVAARVRYGQWIGGVLPEFVPFPKSGKARGGSSRKGSRGKSSEAEGYDDDSVHQDGRAGCYLHLKKLRHPLLLGRHLLEKERSEKAKVRRPGGTSYRHLQSRRGGGSSGSDSGGEESDATAPLTPPPVPIDVTVRAPTRAAIITGPNTGGKTASLKALGLAVLMAKSGLPIPAAKPAVLPCFDAVLADIGDEQSLSASLSTFSGHLRRIEALRKESGSKSLVLLDEVGTGTDPGEGSALGIALLQALVQGGPGGAALTLASTHMGALTSLKYEDPRFENACVEFDEAKLAPTYRLLWGIPGRSNALNIAERLGLDREVLTAARRRLGSTAAEVDSTIVQLEELRRVTEADELEAANLTAELQRVQAATRTLRREMLQMQAESERKKADALKFAVRQARAELQTIKTLKEQEGRKAAAEAAAVAEKNKAEKDYEEQRRSGWKPSVGQKVYVPKLQGYAEVASVGVGGKLTLKKGMLKIAATVDEVRRQQ